MIENITNTTVEFELFNQRPEPNRALPEDLFDCDEQIALATVAALCSGHVRSHGEVLLRQLALFAAGAQVKFHTEDFRDFERKVRTWLNHNQEHVDHEVVAWVLRLAYDRAKSLGMAGPNRVSTDGNAKVNGFAFVEPEDGRGYGNLGADLADELFTSPVARKLTEDEAGWEALRQRFSNDTGNGVDAHTRKCLLTYAAIFAACKPRFCNPEVEAVVVLALYGAGARISLCADRFAALRMQVEYYIGRMQAERFSEFRNRKMAELALEAARKRATLDGIAA